jgi:hypothetical protein
MVDEPIHDDSSYYEISITAGQAFLAVVLLIASLAAAFAFGIVVGEARGKTTLASRARPPVILESEGSERGRIEELGVSDEPFSEQESEEATSAEPVIEEPELIEDPVRPGDASTPSDGPDLSVPGPSPAPSEPAEAVPHVAQILSTTERDAAETLAARLIEAGFSNSYVERVPGGAGMLYRVRVRFASESEAREAVDQLKSFAPGEIWISRAER